MADLAKSTKSLELPVGTLWKDYRIVERIGGDKFGVVYKAQKEGEKEMYALKVGRFTSTIKLEIQLLKEVAREFIAPQRIISGEDEKFDYVVMTLLGPSLGSLYCRSPNTPWSKGTWSRIGIHALYNLKTLHDCGWIHRNINPYNFALGTDLDCREVFLCSFGLAAKHIQIRDGTENYFKKTPREDLIPRRRQHWKKKDSIASHEPPHDPYLITREDALPFRGTPRTYFVPPRAHVDSCGTPGLMSLNASQGKDQGRCDDLWSFIYTLVLFVGELPWLRDEHPVPSADLTLRDLFNKHTSLQLKEPQLKQLDDIDKMLKACDYYSFPDYQMIYELLHSVLEESGKTWDDPYDWEQKDEAWRRAVEKPKEMFTIWKTPGAFFEVDFLCSVLRVKE